MAKPKDGRTNCVDLVYIKRSLSGERAVTERSTSGQRAVNERLIIAEIVLFSFHYPTVRFMEILKLDT